MRITEHGLGHQVTITLEDTAMGQPITAQLSGLYRYALIDGLLWWALCRKLDALVAGSMLPVGHTTTEHAAALYVGEKLVGYVHATPWHESTDERAQRIVRTLHTHIPELAPLGATSAAHQAELDSITKLASIIRDRIGHPGDAGHGLDGIYIRNTAAA